MSHDEEVQGSDEEEDDDDEIDGDVVLEEIGNDSESEEECNDDDGDDNDNDDDDDSDNNGDSNGNDEGEGGSEEEEDEDDSDDGGADAGIVEVDIGDVLHVTKSGRTCRTWKGKSLFCGHSCLMILSKSQNIKRFYSYSLCK